MFTSNGLRLGLAGSLILGTANASAEELARYDFDLVTPSTTALATSSAVGIIAGDATVGEFDEDTSSSDSPQFDSLGFFVRTADTKNTSGNLLANALDAGDYISFTVSGADYDITSITYDYQTSGSGFAFSSYLFSSATSSFADPTLLDASDALFVVNRAGTTSAATTGTFAPLVDLTGTTEFRIYFSDSSFATGNSQRVDTIVVEGVPEPGSLTFIGIGGAGLLLRRRRS